MVRSAIVKPLYLSFEIETKCLKKLPSKTFNVWPNWRIWNLPLKRQGPWYAT